MYYYDQDGAPKIHIYSEMMNDDEVRMEIDTGYVIVNIPLPLTLRELIWPGSAKA